MNWLWWLLLILVALALWGRLAAWLRGPPRPQDIRYHWRHWAPRLVARSRRSSGNWAITLGRRTYVRFGFIRAKHRKHEYEHSLQAHRLSLPVFLVLWVYQCLRYGYRGAGLEVKAMEFAESGDLVDFPDLPRLT